MSVNNSSDNSGALVYSIVLNAILRYDKLELIEFMSAAKI